MNYPYYKLATWCPRTLTFKDGKVAYPTEADALADATKDGTYRISRVAADGTRTDSKPIAIGDAPGPEGHKLPSGFGTSLAPPARRRPATRPMGGRPH